MAASSNPGGGPFPPGPGPFPPPPPSPPPSPIPDGPASAWDVNQVNEFLTALKNFGKQDTVRQIELIRAVQELKNVYASESQQRVVNDFLKKLNESEKWNNFNLSKLRDDLLPARRAAQKEAMENYIERVKVELKAAGIEASDENVDKWLQSERAQTELADLTEKTLNHLASKDEDLAKTLAEYKETQAKLADFIDWRKKVELAKSADSGFDTLLGALRDTATGGAVDPELLKLAHQQINVLSGLKQGFEEYNQKLEDEYMANEKSIRMLWHGLPQAIGQKLQGAESKFTEMFGPELTQTIKFGSKIAQSAGRVLANPRTSINASKETIAQIKEASTSVFSNPKAVARNLRSGLGIEASEAMQKKALAYQARSARIEEKRLPVEAKRDKELTELAKHGLKRGSIFTHDIHLEKLLKKGFDIIGASTGLTKQTIDQVSSIADPLVNFLEDTDDGLRLRADTVVGAKIAGRSLLLTLFAVYDWVAKSKASQSAAWRQSRMITLLEAIEQSLRTANSLSFDEQRRRRLQQKKGNSFIDKMYFGALNGIKKMAGKGIAAVGAALGLKSLSNVGRRIARPIRRSLGGGQRITAFSHLLKNMKGGLALGAVAGTLYLGHKWASRMDEKGNKGVRAGDKRISQIDAAIEKLDKKIDKSWSKTRKEKYQKEKEALEAEKKKIEANKATTGDKILGAAGAVTVAGAATLGAAKIGSMRKISQEAAKMGLTTAEYKMLNPGVGKGFFGILKNAKVGGLLGAAFSAHTIYNAATDATKSREEKAEAIAKAVGSSVGSVLGGVVGSLFGPGIGSMIGSMAGGWIGGWIGKKFAPYALKIWDTMIAPFKPVFRLISIFFEKTKKVWEGLWEILKGIALGIWESLKMLWDGIKDVFSGIWDIISAPFKAIWEWFKSVFSGIMSIVDGIADIFENPSEKLWEGLKKIGLGLWKIMIAPFKGLWVLVKGLGKGFWSLIKGFGKILAAPFVGLWEIIKGLGRGLLKIGSFAWDVIKGLGKFIFVTLPLLILKGLKALFIDLPILIMKWLWKGLVWLVTDLPGLILKGLKAVFIDLPILIGKWIWQGLVWLAKLPGKLIKMAWDWLFGGDDTSDAKESGGLWGWVKGKIAAFWDWITSPFRAIADWVKDKFNWVSEKIGAAVDWILTPFKVLGGIFDWIGEKLKWFWDLVTSPFEAVKKVVEWVQDKFGWIAHPIDSAKEKAAEIWDGAKDLASKAADKVSGWWDSATSWFTGSKKAVEAVKEKTKEITQTTIEKSTEVATAVKEKTKDFTEATKETSKSAAAGIKKLGEGANKAITVSFSKSISAMSGAAAGVATKTKDVASTVKEKMQPAIDVTKNTSAKVIEATSAAIEKKKEDISKSASTVATHISSAVETTKETTVKIVDKTKKVASDTAFYGGVAVDVAKDFKDLGLKDTVRATKAGIKLYNGKMSEITADEFKAAAKVGGIGIKAGWKVAWKKIKDKASSIWGKIKGGVKSFFGIKDAPKESGPSVWQRLKDRAKNLFGIKDEQKEAGPSIWQKLKEGAKNLFGKEPQKEAGPSIWQRLKDKATSLFGGKEKTKEKSLSEKIDEKMGTMLGKEPEKKEGFFARINNKLKSLLGVPVPPKSYLEVVGQRYNEILEKEKAQGKSIGLFDKLKAAAKSFFPKERDAASPGGFLGKIRDKIANFLWKDEKEEKPLGFFAKLRQKADNLFKKDQKDEKKSKTVSAMIDRSNKMTLGVALGTSTIQKQEEKTSIWSKFFNKKKSTKEAVLEYQKTHASMWDRLFNKNKSATSIEETQDLLGTKAPSVNTPVADGTKAMKEEGDKTLREDNPIGAAIAENTRRTHSLVKALEDVAAYLKGGNNSTNVSVAANGSSGSNTPYRDIPSDVDSLGLLITNKIWGIAN